MAVTKNRLTLFQGMILTLPIAGISLGLLVAASWQIHQWGLSWVWGIITLVLVGWRWLLVRWTKPLQTSINVLESLESLPLREPGETDQRRLNLENQLQEILQKTQPDQPLWENFPLFLQRCQEVIITVAQTYHPEVKYPLLNIYIPQAYGLIRGTVDDLDRWLTQLSPALNQITLAQAYQSYEIYQQLEPSLRKAWQLWNWAQWFINPTAAIARQISQSSNEQANQALLGNFNQLLREAALRNLARQAIVLYSGQNLPDQYFATSPVTLAKPSTQTLQELFLQAESPEKVEEKPINLFVVGRTGAGKSSLINSLFRQSLIVTDVLPNTSTLQEYHWQTSTGESLILWDSPGYEQNQQTALRKQVLNQAHQADLLLLLTPALDPSLQMDGEFLQDFRAQYPDIPVFCLVTQADKVRPLKEWQPPYDWQWGEKAKEQNIRAAVQYRAEQLGDYCDHVFPIVNGEPSQGREEWGLDNLSLALFSAIAPAKQLRLARFLQNIETRTLAAAQIIERYSFQMTTTHGLAAFLKSPLLQLIARLMTGNPTLAYVLAEKIPIEQLPLVIGKLQMAYELYELLKTEQSKPLAQDLLTLWPLLLENEDSPDRQATALGQTLMAYWLKP
ncbi:MAG: GTPase [Merismopediaceae bacterium]|nr:GTPase [Merismopediaceae bacterium]